MVSFEQLKNRERAVAVVGLGYVGLPLAVALAEHFDVIGFDIASSRVEELNSGSDHTGEVEPEALAASTVAFTDDPAALGRAGCIIVAVPTPIDIYRKPDLTPVLSASELVGKYMATGTVVVFESTVYPGLTEESCVPLLEQHSGLLYGRDFAVGYSPERMNPGDKEHTVRTIVKVVAGNDGPTAELLRELYGAIVEAGIHVAPSIKVAEAAKVIENTQRDLNIALMNELSLICHKLGIDTADVLDAASTKWNFLPFRPGLVGGHCIGVDPYYLTFKAESMGIHPQVILAGRQINDSVGRYVGVQAIKFLARNGAPLNETRVAVLGLTFKENVPDLRNTRVIDVVRELQDHGVTVLAHDPVVSPEMVKRKLGLDLVDRESLYSLDAVVLAVDHAAFSDITAAVVKSWHKDPARALVLDVKGMLDRGDLEREGVQYWRL